uniref:Uncharacterized protein n=1 Tax=Glossina brevipalpis TaxID=37001 RepID=A0A1A9WWI2_9MUSC
MTVKHTCRSLASGVRNKSRTLSIRTRVKVDEIDERLRAFLREEYLRDNGGEFFLSEFITLKRRTIDEEFLTSPFESNLQRIEIFSPIIN